MTLIYFSAREVRPIELSTREVSIALGIYVLAGLALWRLRGRRDEVVASGVVNVPTAS